MLYIPLLKVQACSDDKFCVQVSEMRLFRTSHKWILLYVNKKKKKANVLSEIFDIYLVTAVYNEKIVWFQQPDKCSAQEYLP